MVNRALVLTLWAVVVAEVLGFEHDEAQILGRAVAGLNAYSKGVSLGSSPGSQGGKEQQRKMRKEGFRQGCPGNDSSGRSRGKATNYNSDVPSRKVSSFGWGKDFRFGALAYPKGECYD